MKDEIIAIAKATKAELKMQKDNKFISLERALDLKWISKTTGLATKKYASDKATEAKAKERATAKKDREKQAKIEAKAKDKAKRDAKKEREAQAKTVAKAKEAKRKERIKEKFAREEQAIADAKVKKEALAQLKIEAKAVGLPEPKRLPRKSVVAQEYTAIDGTVLKSPYKLDRRSGYRIIWQVLAERHDQIVSNDYLHDEVNKRLAEDPATAKWYVDTYSSKTDALGQAKDYPVITNAATVMTRHPYNGVTRLANDQMKVDPVSLEGLKQRIIAGSRGVMLKTNVEEPYFLKPLIKRAIVAKL
jgi:hypothetical protein